jgi:hypothetical protein
MLYVHFTQLFVPTSGKLSGWSENAMRRAIDEWLNDVLATNKASVTFWVPHATLEKKEKCAKNNLNRMFL